MLLRNNTRQTEQTNSSSILNQSKPPIRFSYNSPVQSSLPPEPILKCIESFGAVPQQKVKTNVELSRQPSLQIFSKIAENLGEKSSHKRKRRNKIFQRTGSSIFTNRYSKDRSIFSSDFKNKDKVNSAMHYSQPQKKKSRRKGIFTAYNPKEVIGYAFNVNDQDAASRHFPINKPAHPKSLVHYVDLAPHRKKKLFETKDPFQKTFGSQMHDKEWFSKIDSQKTSQIPKCQSKIMDAPLIQSMQLNDEEDEIFQKKMNTSIVNVHDFPEIAEAAPRFFDKNQDEISEVSNNTPYVDLKYMGSTNFSLWRKPALSVEVNPVITNTPTSPTLPPQPSFPILQPQATQIRSKKDMATTHTIQKVEKSFEKATSTHNYMPYLLVFLGFLLFVIQTLK